jgi:hypothetical protein
VREKGGDVSESGSGEKKEKKGEREVLEERSSYQHRHWDLPCPCLF